MPGWASIEAHLYTAGAWRAYFGYKANYLDARPPYALTVHKSQGSTYHDGVWLDLDDIGRNTKATELKRLVYVAITRTGSKVHVTGALPERYGSCTS